MDHSVKASKISTEDLSLQNQHSKLVYLLAADLGVKNKLGCI